MLYLHQLRAVLWDLGTRIFFHIHRTGDPCRRLGLHKTHPGFSPIVPAGANRVQSNGATRRLLARTEARACGSRPELRVLLLHCFM